MTDEMKAEAVTTAETKESAMVRLMCSSVECIWPKCTGKACGGDTYYSAAHRLTSAGLVIVPREPTEEMLCEGAAAFDACHSVSLDGGLDEDPIPPIYKAMISLFR